MVLLITMLLLTSRLGLTIFSWYIHTITGNHVSSPITSHLSYESAFVISLPRQNKIQDKNVYVFIFIA